MSQHFFSLIQIINLFSHRWIFQGFVQYTNFLESIQILDFLKAKILLFFMLLRCFLVAKIFLLILSTNSLNRILSDNKFLQKPFLSLKIGFTKKFLREKKKKHYCKTFTTFCFAQSLKLYFYLKPSAENDKQLDNWYFCIDCFTNWNTEFLFSKNSFSSSNVISYLFTLLLR